MPRQYSKSTKFKTFFWHPLAATAVFFNNLFLVIGPFCSLSLRTFNLRWMGPWMWCETALGPCAWVRHTWEPRPGRWKGSGKDLSNPWVNETEHIATVGLKIEHPWHVLFYSKGPKFVGLIFDLWMHIPISVTCQQLSGGPMEHLNPRNSNSSDGIRRFWSFCFCQVLWGPFPGLLAKLPVSLLVRLLEQDALNAPEDATLTAILKGGGLGVEICRCFTCIYIYIHTHLTLYIEYANTNILWYIVYTYFLHPLLITLVDAGLDLAYHSQEENVLRFARAQDSFHSPVGWWSSVGETVGECGFYGSIWIHTLHHHPQSSIHDYLQRQEPLGGELFKDDFCQPFLVLPQVRHVLWRRLPREEKLLTLSGGVDKLVSLEGKEASMKGYVYIYIHIYIQCNTLYIYIYMYMYICIWMYVCLSVCNVM